MQACSFSFVRLRQCCCHLNLLTSVLGKGEDDRDEVDLEVAMSALTLDRKEADSQSLKVYAAPALSLYCSSSAS